MPADVFTKNVPRVRFEHLPHLMNMAWRVWSRRSRNILVTEDDQTSMMLFKFEEFTGTISVASLERHVVFVVVWFILSLQYLVERISTAPPAVHRAKSKKYEEEKESFSRMPSVMHVALFLVQWKGFLAFGEKNRVTVIRRLVTLANRGKKSVYLE